MHPYGKKNIYMGKVIFQDNIWDYENIKSHVIIKLEKNKQALIAFGFVDNHENLEGVHKCFIGMIQRGRRGGCCSSFNTILILI